MKLIPKDAKRIKITFVCDLCGVDTICEADVPTEEVFIEAVCPVCYKEFSVKITPEGIEVPDVSDEDVSIEVIN